MRAAGERPDTLEMHRIVGAAVGLMLVIVPAIASFYDNGIVDFTVEAIFVAGALGLPMVIVGFAATRAGRAASSGVIITVDRLLTLALLAASAFFITRGEEAAGLLFAGAALIFALLLLTRRGSTGEVERQGGGATTVAGE